jgi:hypothetical protein
MMRRRRCSGEGRVRSEGVRFGRSEGVRIRKGEPSEGEGASGGVWGEGGWLESHHFKFPLIKLGSGQSAGVNGTQFTGELFSQEWAVRTGSTMFLNGHISIHPTLENHLTAVALHHIRQSQKEEACLCQHHSRDGERWR